MDDHLTRAVEFIHTTWKISKRNQFPLQIADLILVRLTNVQDEQVIATLLPRLQIFGCNFWNTGRHWGSLLTTNPAEFFIIDQFCDRTMFAAHRAFWIFAQLQFTEAHGERIKQ